MTKVPDRAKMRREYVWKKTFALMLPIGFVLAFGTILVAFMFAVRLLAKDIRSHPVAMACDGAIFLMMLGMAIMKSLRLAREASQEAKSVPYIPPIRKQIAPLPAEEVLLRGSQASAELPEELLRASLPE